MCDSSLAQELRTQADLVWIAASPSPENSENSNSLFPFGFCMLIISIVFYLSYYKCLYHSYYYSDSTKQKSNIRLIGKKNC